VTILAVLLLTGCEKSGPPPENTSKAKMSGYELALKSGLENWPDPKAFNELFPNSLHVINYYSGEVGEPKWSSKISLYKRYVFRMSLPIQLDHSRTKIVGTGTPEFDLYEIDSVAKGPSDSFSGQTHLVSRPSVEDWRKLVQANGNFAAIGINLDTNRPLDNFPSTPPF
jgi:hypothetical protein